MDLIVSRIFPTVCFIPCKLNKCKVSQNDSTNVREFNYKGNITKQWSVNVIRFLVSLNITLLSP